MEELVDKKIHDIAAAVMGGQPGGAMTFTESIRTCFTKYADFKGCAGKSEYWWWVLFTLVASVSLQIVSHNLSLAFSVATILPSIAVTARRLHDTDRTGWLQLLVLIPVIGWIILLIWYVQDGKRPNRFGQPELIQE